MQILRSATTHSSFFNLAIRFVRILMRYGFTQKKMKTNLELYLEILRENGFTPTFPLTANLLNKHSDLIKNFSEKGVEFCCHGYNHIDYTCLPQEIIKEHLKKAIEIFKQHELPISGFRFPYLRSNNKCINYLSLNCFQWDSSFNVLWKIGEKVKCKKRNLLRYKKMLDRYEYRSSDSHISLPRFHENILEIPVSLPDDDLLERLGVNNPHPSTKIWGNILKKTYSRGELFTLQLHPERILIFREPLQNLLNSLNHFEPKIWVASLNSIFKWWEEKKEFSATLTRTKYSEYEIEINCTPRASILIRPHSPKKDAFYNGYSLIKNRRFRIKTHKKPIVGVSKDSAPELFQFLKNEGFIFEKSQERDSFSVFLEDITNLDEKDNLKILEMIHETEFPLLRFWRWPNECRSALSITGDIDCITLTDFLSRISWN